MAPDHPKIAAIVLAAGASKRFGRSKPLARLNDKPLLQHVLERLSQAKIEPVILVLGPDANAILSEIDIGNARVVVSSRSHEGMSRSLQAGIKALPEEIAGTFVILADQPFVSPDTLLQLIEAHRREHPAAVVPTYNQFRGNPVLLDRSLFKEVMKIEGDIGCRAIFGHHPGQILKLPVSDPGILTDIDTPEDLEAAEKKGAAVSAGGNVKEHAHQEQEGEPAQEGSLEESSDLFERVVQLKKEGTPFALATVVRSERPTSAKPGAKAVVLKDGSLIGFIGGSCARDTVIQNALDSIQDGKNRLVALTNREVERRSKEGVVKAPMPCYSGGALDIFIEPHLPKPLLIVLGGEPVAQALVRLGKALQFHVAVIDPAATLASHPEADQIVNTLSFESFKRMEGAAVVIATHGRFDEEAIEQVIGTPATYIALVASGKRAGVILQQLQARGASPEGLRRVRSPAGIDIGAVAPEEIALSILAEIVQARRRREKETKKEILPSGGETDAKDPICGMTVQVEGARHQSNYQGRSYYFCCAGCKEIFEADPATRAGKG
jgi:xanthine dehydrogenase accessory factor